MLITKIVVVPVLITARLKLFLSVLKKLRRNGVLAIYVISDNKGDRMLLFIYLLTSFTKLISN